MTTLTTNAFPITIPFETFQVSRLPYDAAKLSKLRANHNKTHSFFRVDTFIYCSPMIDCELPFATETVTLSVTEEKDVAGRLIEHIFFKTFISAFPDRKPIKFYPFTLLSTLDTHDLASKALPIELHGQIVFTRQITIHLRHLETESGFRFAFVPEINHRWQTSLTLKQMLQKGYQLNGLSVVHTYPTPGYEGVFAPDERLVGEIIDHDDIQATVRTNSGDESYPLDQLHIRMYTQEVKQYLRHVIGESRAEQAIDKIMSDKRKTVTPVFLFNETQTLLRHLSRLQYSNLDSFTFSLNLEPYASSLSFPLEETRLCFDPTPGSVDTLPLRGLSRFGPYDSGYFTPKEPNVLVLCHHSVRGRVSEFLGALQTGVRHSQYYPSGMQALLRLNSLRFTIQDVDGLLPDNYEQAVDKAVKSPDAPHYTAAIVVAQEAWKEYRPEINPYLRAKAKLMTAGIPVQSVKETNVLKKSGESQFMLAPIAVQIYAKCGGIPWLLPAKSGVDVELVIGIGTAILKDNPWIDAERSRFVGITTFFTGNGQFLLGKRMEPVRYEDYSSALLDNIKSTLSRLSQEYHWEKGASVRLVFHAHKPFRNIEADAVARVIECFLDYHVTYAFIQISTDHPLLLLRANGDSNTHEEQFARRGDNMKLNSKTVLLQLKSPGRGIHTNPVQVTLHKDSTFKDFHYVCQQIVDFSQLNWRSIQPSRQPITIFYSELLAGMWSRLKKTGYWDPITLTNPQLRKSLWFL